MSEMHRGFASMSVDKRREISGKGGRAAHIKGTAHEWTKEEARIAGRKGGMASRRGRLQTGPSEGLDGHMAAAFRPSPVAYNDGGVLDTPLSRHAGEAQEQLGGGDLTRT